MRYVDNQVHELPHVFHRQDSRTPVTNTLAGIIMCSDVGEQKNIYLDQILAERRSYRMFSTAVPEPDAIRRILHAGLLAPYAAAAVGGSKDYFRRFFVMKKGSQSMDAAIPCLLYTSDAADE